jgi:polyketide synthase 13
MTQKKLTAREIETWLINWVSKETGKKAHEVDPEETFINLGLSSRQAITLTGEIEDELNMSADVSSAWDHPSIRKLAAHLAAQQKG